jgi:endonuclease/exonuclease/phosphatase family metal-dependent hydrolase
MTIPSNVIKVVMADFNAKVDREQWFRPVIGNESLHNISNNNGERLISFATTRGMTISSTQFQHKNIHKHTWISTGSSVKNQIDHMMIDSRRKRRVIDVKKCRGISGVSDHFLVQVMMHIRSIGV